MGKSGLKRARGSSNEGAAKLARSAASGDVSAAKTGQGKSSDGGAPTKGQDADGNVYWELSKMRRVGVSQFKGNALVNIREYYESAGQMRPGKKGISLSVDQFKMLAKAIPLIAAQLRNDGVDLGDLAGAEDGAEDSAADADEAEPSAPKTKAKKPAERSNIDATSDEDSN